MTLATGAVVTLLHRYPVKSMLGEAVERLEVDARGCAGDRVWAVCTGDGLLGSGRCRRRSAALPDLQLVRASPVRGHVVLRFPDGAEHAVQDPAAAHALSEHVGRAVTLTPETDGTHCDDGPVSLRR